MKYAFAILLTLYLLVYGCSSDKPGTSEKEKTNISKTTTGPTKEPGKRVEEIAVTPGPKTQPPPATKQEEAASIKTTEKEQPIVSSSESTPQGPIEIIQPDLESVVVMPCGRVYLKSQVANAPCFKMEQPCFMFDETAQRFDEDEDYVSMPCGHRFADCSEHSEEIPPDPSLSEPPCMHNGQNMAGLSGEEDLTSALQKMVETTNSLAKVTQQLVNATQAMVRATTDGTLKNENRISDANLPINNPTHKETSNDDRELLKTVQDAVLAVQKAVEAMNQSIANPRQQKQ